MKGFHVVAAIVFLIAGLFHLIRSLNGWDLVIGGWAAPLWLSWLLVLITGSMVVWAFKSKE